LQIECLDDFVDNNSEVRVIDKIIDTLDIENLEFFLGDNAEVGRPKFDPRNMLKLLVYGYFNGLRSSRKLAKQSIINREIICLKSRLQPKYRVIADFKKDNIEALTKVFDSFFDLCIKLGLYGKELIAVDGTKIEASASKRKYYSKNKLSKMKEIAQNKINEYMDDLEKNDLLKDEDKAKFEKEKIENIIEILESRINEYIHLEKDLEVNGINEVNLTDPDAITVKLYQHQGTDVGYNIQAAVDSKNKLIAAFEVTNNSADQGNLYNAIIKTKEKFSVEKIEVLAGKGYFETPDLKRCEDENITCYVSKPRYIA
jgi:transposase